MSKPMAERIRQLHAAYCRQTGLVVSLDFWRESQWFEFIRRGFTESDLRAVIGAIRKGIAEGSRNRGALRFHNLVGQVDLFEEELAEVNARRPRPGYPARAAALRATGRCEDLTTPAKPAGQVAQRIVSDPEAAAKAFAEFQKFKNSL